jgi:uncharacterized protein (DUF697 family)
MLPNPVSSVREVLAIVRELSFDELRWAATREPRIAVVGRTQDEAREIALHIFGVDARRLVVAQGEGEPWPDNADIVLLDRRARVIVPVGSQPVIDVDGGEDPERARHAIVRIDDDLTLALGRSFAALRNPAAVHTVNVTTRVNTQFALVSNVPALIPVVGGILAAGADTIVLTKNQLMMIYKLAAIHGRDLDRRMRLYQEMVPVVGAGLFWRTVARELAALMPLAAGTVPKVAIAYAGTYVAGMAAHIYYLEGKRPNTKRIQALYAGAVEELRESPAFRTATQRAARHIPWRRDASHVIDVDYTVDASSGTP